MVRIMRFLTLVLFVTLPAILCQGQEYPYRWVYVSRSLQRDGDVVDIKNIVKTASQSGLNGMVLAAGLDRLDGRDPEYFERLKQVQQLCKQQDFEIIPIIFSVGYGGSILAEDKNLAAGLPVKDALFVVENSPHEIGKDLSHGVNQARFVPGTTAKIINPGLEQYEGNRLKGYNFHDRPGEVSFIDTRVFNSGRASLRFEGFGNYEHGHARIMQEVKVDPQRCYRVSCTVRTESLEPEGAFRIMVLSPDGRNLAPWDPKVPSTSDWRQVTMGFNSMGFDRVRIYLGAWGGQSGRFWIDELRVEEVGLLNVLRRPGTPVTVKDEQTGFIYKEGKDYASIEDPQLNFRFDHEPVAIEILPGSPQDGQAHKISNGRRLRVSYYHGMAINSGQVTVCMSEPKVYEIWDRQIRLLHEILAPSRYLLSMDEIRAGGSCQACKKRNMTMAQILGDCITEQVRIIRNVNPQAEVLIWSDMLDPNHNAHANYYLVDGDFNGSWNYVPEDLVIVCWYYDKRAESLAFFSSLGFRTLAGAYYDGDTLDNPSGWLDVLEATPGASGIMYTTWRNKYDLLAPFGNLVTERGRVK